jgi:hypothetical protein
LNGPLTFIGQWILGAALVKRCKAQSIFAGYWGSEYSRRRMNVRDS